LLLGGRFYQQIGGKKAATMALGTNLRRSAISHVPGWLHPALRRAEQGGNAMVGAALRMLPGTSREFGPPRQIAPTLREYANANPSVAAYTEIYPTHRIYRSVPRVTETELHPEFVAEQSRLAWPAGVGVIERGRVVTSMGAIIAPEDFLIADVSHTASADDARLHPIFAKMRLPRITSTDASVAVLTMYASNIKDHYYYSHWMLDALPRFALLEKSGIGWDRLVAPQATHFHRDTLRLLGIDESRIIAERDLHIQSAKLVVPTLPGLPGNPPHWVCDFLRRRFLPLAPPSTRSDRRLYISREKARTRHVLNEAELVQALERRGFERVFLEDLTFLEQVRLLNEASVVISPHSTGLTNVVFCRPGTKVIEIFSPRYVTTFFFSIASQVGLDYGYVLGHGDSGGGHRVHEDIIVEVPRVLSLLDEMLDTQHIARAPAARDA
jgi:capsular polysaccharide biosynthesis protein